MIAVYKLISIFISILALTVIVRSQDTQINELLQQTISIKAKNADLDDLLRYLSKTYRIPIGFEIPKSSSGQTKKHNIEINNVSAKLYLDLLFKKYPKYHYQIADGIINVKPKGEINSPLDVIINDFVIYEQDRKSTIKMIYGLSELKNKLTELNAHPGVAIISKPLIKDNLKISVNLKKRTLRQVLNEISKTTFYWTTSYLGDYFFINL